MLKSRWWIAGALFAAVVSGCGGGGGGTASTPYTGLTTPAVITDDSAGAVALAAFEGGDLGASTGVLLAPAGATNAAARGARPWAVTLVHASAKAAGAAVGLPAGEGPSLRAVITVDNVIDDGQGGQASYTLSVNDATGAFTGSFAFANFHGDGGGVVNGNVAVSGAVTENGFRMLFDFQTVRITDGTAEVDAIGTLNLALDLAGPAETGSATLNMVFRDSVTLETVWLSNLQMTDVAGTGHNDVTLSGRIYLFSYGYVDVATVVPFRYLDGATNPSSGQMTVTGDQNRGVRLTADSATGCTVEVDSDADGLYDDLSISLSW
jgi:hypothetical protein